MNESLDPPRPPAGEPEGQSLYLQLVALLERIEREMSRYLLSGEIVVPPGTPGAGMPRAHLLESLITSSMPSNTLSRLLLDFSRPRLLLAGEPGDPFEMTPDEARDLLERIRRVREQTPSIASQQLEFVLHFLEHLIFRISDPLSSASGTKEGEPRAGRRKGGAAGDRGIGVNLLGGLGSGAPGSEAFPLEAIDPPEWWPKPPELRKWVLCFKNRLAVQMYLNHLFEPGWPEIDEHQAQNLIDQARSLQNNLTRAEKGRIPPAQYLARLLEIPEDLALIVFYLLLAEVGEWEFNTRGAAILCAVGREIGPHDSLVPFAPGSPLIEKGLIRVVRGGRTAFSSTYRLSHDTLRLILGNFTGPKFFDRVPGGERDQLGELREPRIDLKDVILPEKTRNALMDALVLADPEARSLVASPEMASLFYKARGTVFLFEGPPGTGKTMAAEGIARYLGKSLYIARYDRMIDMWMGEMEKNVSRVFGEAEEANAVLLLDEADALLASRGTSYHSADKARNTSVNLLLRLLEEYEGIVILTTNLATKLDAAVERRLTARVRFDIPGPPERELIWRSHMDESVQIEGDLDIPWLAQRFVLTGARIRSAVLVAFRKALRRKTGMMERVRDGRDVVASRKKPRGKKLQILATDLVEASREQARSSFRDRAAAQPDDNSEVGELRNPGFGLERVVLPEKLLRQLQDALTAMRPEARALFESDSFMSKFQTGRGVIFLFEGTSGTGKTMAAEAIAGELGRPLYVVRLERLMSMWVGQSEKGIARVFDEAQAHDAVLLIDEADSLLGNRSISGPGDRLGNNLVNLLLNLLEECTGIVILTTNLQSSLDKALDRRLTARLTFPPPDYEGRIKILQSLFPDDIQLGEDVDLPSLARRYPVTGGLIRNVVLTAMRLMVVENPSVRILHQRHLEQAFQESRTADGKSVGFRVDTPPPQPT